MVVTQATLHDGCQMLLDSDTWFQQKVMLEQEYDAFGISTALQYLPPEGVFLDIGANIGLWTCPLGLVARARQATGFAFEPVAANYHRLRENLTLNGLDNVAAHKLALGREAGLLNFHIEPGGETNNAIGDNLLLDHDRVAVEQQGWGRDSAPVMPLDNWASAQGLTCCDVIKIDVEGAEPLVLQGGRQFLRRTRPVIFGEFNPYWMNQIGWQFEQVQAWFEGWDYLFFREVENAFVPLTPELIARPPDVPSYLLLPREKTL